MSDIDHVHDPWTTMGMHSHDSNGTIMVSSYKKKTLHEREGFMIYIACSLVVVQ
jgi:hypothetical protein